MQLKLNYLVLNYKAKIPKDKIIKVTAINFRKNMQHSLKFKGALSGLRQK